MPAFRIVPMIEAGSASTGSYWRTSPAANVMIVEVGRVARRFTLTVYVPGGRLRISYWPSRPAGTDAVVTE